ncbi:MAG: response regulator [Bdellovibrionota bacterium]|nr:response regulator [Bdellovibrionota bacterium]
MRKIIIIDDAFTLRVQLRSALETVGYEVVEADDGLTGLDVIESNPDASILISDVNMYSMDGLTMLKEVKEKKLLPDAGKICLTTETNPEMKKKGKKAGLDAWFTKPLTPKRLEILLGLIEKLIVKRFK